MTTLSIGAGLNGIISAAGEHDYYQVSLVAGQTYTFTADGAGLGAGADDL